MFEDTNRPQRFVVAATISDSKCCVQEMSIVSDLTPPR